MERFMEIENALADVLLKNRSGIALRLKEQASELAKTPCSDRSLGAWLEDYELPILIELLNSPDEYFHDRFDNLKDFDLAKRKKLAGDILEHSKVCAHCRLKVSFDSEFADTVDEVIEDNREELRRRITVSMDKT
jgi:hypothetical protein